ncbi:hypothetical protein T440DRAFT_516218 [Plenodomus tracheiphilus IPT5]|uniref:Uncharacterized protein n=1 Tax=Plenodomus tracheiphilus IPT5 TaxID=1408161 RepID=A0A6A7BEW5_9PLEO|nr:hypothetical protein T440DRAFT_516218 [Plenodomus tracheiphilus IPT5]
MFHLNEALHTNRDIRNASRPGLHPDFYVRCTREGTTYYLPSYEKVRSSKVFLQTEDGEPQRVTAVTNLPLPIERYLPPAGQYYDQYAVGDAIHAEAMDPNGKCLTCYRLRHGTEGKRCKKKCLICDTFDHPGQPCKQLFVENDWWKEHDRILGADSEIPVRPSLAEWAYLAIAGIVEDIKDPKGPIVVVPDHPIVDEFYRRIQPPEMKFGPPPKLPISKRRKAPAEPAPAHLLGQRANEEVSKVFQNTEDSTTGGPYKDELSNDLAWMIFDRDVRRHRADQAEERVFQLTGELEI